jgi:hypothetical protein
MTQQLYAYHSSNFKGDSEDIRLWKLLYSSILTASSSYIDRTGTINLPINVGYPESLALPDYDEKFSMSYVECCQARVSELLHRQEKIDGPIRIMYSGGIDSSLILSSFIERLGIEQCGHRIELVMTNLSREENPTMWEKFIRRSNIKLINAFDFGIKLEKNAILISGELNDQLFHPATQTCPLLHWTSMEELLKPWSEAKLVDYFVWAKLELSDAEFYADLLAKLARRAKFEISSLWDLFWYLNLTGKWTSCFFQNLLMFNSGEVGIDAEIMEQGRFDHFYSSKEFQLWAMVNREHKHKGTPDSTKWYPRKLVADFMQDSAYEHKSKYGSLYHIVRARHAHVGMDNDFNFVGDLDSFYNPNNSFKK